MRWGGPTVMLALVLGAISALAQESAGIIPVPTQSAEKAGRVHVARHAALKKD